MKLPKTLKIAGHEVRVVFPYDFKEVDSSEGRYNGYAELEEDKILIGGDRSPAAMNVTLIHEILHFIDYFYCGREILDKLGDRPIAGLAEGLYQVLKDNRLVLWEALESEQTNDNENQ